jgi:hypothetical protein
MTEKTEPPLVGTEILTFFDKVAWVACWIRYDIVAQGETEKQAVDRLLRAISYHCIYDAKRPRALLKEVPKPSPKLVDEWKRRHELAHPPALKPN